MFNKILHENNNNLRIILTLFNNHSLPINALAELLSLNKKDIVNNINILLDYKYIIKKNSLFKKGDYTIITLTKRGRFALKRYIKQLEKFLKEN